MTVRVLIDQAIELAKALSPMIPALGTGVAIAENLEKIFDSLQDHATVDQQSAMQTERAEIQARVTAKAKAESAALRG